jgi:putative ABC transport system substrate-binding protein
VSAFAREANSGLIVVSSPIAGLHRDLIIRLAAEHKLPAVYSFDYYAANGGLIAYGPDPNDPFLRAADYLDRILKGAKPSDLPVQAPTKYKLGGRRPEDARRLIDALAMPRKISSRRCRGQG